jgi:hypothetical protein
MACRILLYVGLAKDDGGYFGLSACSSLVLLVFSVVEDLPYSYDQRRIECAQLKPKTMAFVLHLSAVALP